jgi:hypothetical protein
MPAFGPTHNDQQLWGTVAFLRRLPKLNAEEYGKMVKAVGPQEHGKDDHHHHDQK